MQSARYDLSPGTAEHTLAMTERLVLIPERFNRIVYKWKLILSRTRVQSLAPDNYGRVWATTDLAIGLGTDQFQQPLRRVVH